MLVHLVAAALLAASLSVYVLFVLSGEDDGVRGPILIVADDYFTAENGVSSGAGTEADPFVIEDLVIEVPSDPALSGQGIRISHTAAHFVIRNVTMRPDGPGWDRSADYPVGVFLNYAENATVESCAIEGMGVGIEMVATPGATIRENALTGCGVGVHSDLTSSVGYLRGLSVTGNEFVNDTIGIHVHYSPWDIEIVGNSFVDNGEPAVIQGCREVVFEDNDVTVTGAGLQGQFGGPVFTACHDLRVSSNTMAGIENDGLSVDGSFGVTLVGNAIGCDGRGLVLVGSDDVNATGNVITSLLVGIWAQSSDGVEIASNHVAGSHISFAMVSPDGAGGAVSVYHNHIEVVTAALVDDGGLDVSWDAGYPEGGNFWEGAIDPYSNEDLDGDGISDTAFYLDEDSFDGYPLMSTPL
jgi:hypothetical protein